MLYILLFLLILGFIYLNGPRIVYRTVTDKYQRFRSLNTLVSTQHTNQLKILWVAVCLICKMLYLSLWQKLNKTIVKVDKNIYEIQYVLEGKLYRMLVSPKRGPSRVLQVIEEDEDVTDHVLPYLGPQENASHALTLTPKLLGRKDLVFNLATGDDLLIRDHQVIVLHESKKEE